MEKEFKIRFIYHSCYLVEFSDTILIFDYFEGDLPPLDKNKKLIFVATHSHYDHFSEKIFHIGNPEENIYVLSDDIKPLVQKDNIVYLQDDEKNLDIDTIKFLIKSENVHFVAPDEVLKIGDFIFETYGSTDKGISLTVSRENLVFYYAGDLNNWIWEEDSPAERQEMEKDFLKEIRKVSSGVDIAFFPVDPRLGENYDKGVSLFLEEIKPQVLFPMHFKEDIKFTEKFFQDYKGKTTTQIRKIQALGEEFILSVDIGED